MYNNLDTINPEEKKYFTVKQINHSELDSSDTWITATLNEYNVISSCGINL
jgi:hypothetical protein